MSKQPYQPISCVFYDFIEHYAIKRLPVPISYVDEKGKIQSITSIIKDTLTKDGKEYIIIDGLETPLRMDYLVSIDGNNLSDYQKC